MIETGDMVERVEPVAWMYTLEGDPYSPYLHRRRQSVYACPPHIETPLYAAPPAALAASGADRMREALERILRMRPAGDVATATGTRALVQRMEAIACQALTYNQKDN